MIFRKIVEPECAKIDIDLSVIFLDSIMKLTSIFLFLNQKENNKFLYRKWIEHI